MARNDFLEKLLNLQQDGRDAISAPTNWLDNPPLLRVETDLSQLTREISASILGNKGGVGCWHFFVGSPGNGKSAAVGELAIRLRNDHNCSITDESGTALDNLAPTDVPYLLRIFAPGNDKYPVALIVQDASVVRNPFAQDVDPARELLDTISSAWERGLSLVVCTNRGVIEKAYRDVYLDPLRKENRWVAVLKGLVDVAETSTAGEIDGAWKPVGARAVFGQLKISYSFLDNRSLLIGSDIFRDLLASATAVEKWQACNECNAISVCPFKANRDWIADERGQEALLQILRRTEAHSGQVIVFREALAIVSLILAGCAKDYATSTPCDWVEDRRESGDLFALMSRRVYSLLFMSRQPRGLESDLLLQEEQREALRTIEGTGALSENATRAIRNVLSAPPPSTDVGVNRLTAANGALTSLDETFQCTAQDIFERWTADLQSLLQYSHPLLGELERKCVEVWRELDEAISAQTGYENTEVHWRVKRWLTGYLIRLALTAAGRTAHANELDEFIAIVAVLMKAPEKRTLEEKIKLRDVDDSLANLLDSLRMNPGADAGADVIPLTESTILRGAWVERMLKPRVSRQTAAKALFVGVEFENTKNSETALLSARAFLWLRRHERFGLSPACFPKELLAGLFDARIRAASRGGARSYAFAPDDIILEIVSENGKILVERVEGDIRISDGD